MILYALPKLTAEICLVQNCKKAELNFPAFLQFCLCHSKNKSPCYAGEGKIFRYKYELLCYYKSGSAKPQIK